MQRSDIILQHSGVSICVTGCQKRESKARLCIVLWRTQSIRAKMKWENQELHALNGCIDVPLLLGFKHLFSA